MQSVTQLNFFSLGTHFTYCSGVSIFDIEQANASWATYEPTSLKNNNTVNLLPWMTTLNRFHTFYQCFYAIFKHILACYWLPNKHLPVQSKYSKDIMVSLFLLTLNIVFLLYTFEQVIICWKGKCFFKVRNEDIGTISVETDLIIEYVISEFES